MSGVNPKNEEGQKKPDLSLVPPSAIIYMATAFMDGEIKYGPYNWRETVVSMRVYTAALERHYAAFMDREDFDPKTKVHHLAYVMANCAVILDGMELGVMVDNRPKKGNSGELIRRFREQGHLMPKEGILSLAPGTPEKVATLEAALRRLAVTVTEQESVCKLCDTVTEFQEGQNEPPHQHDPKCILYRGGA